MKTDDFDFDLPEERIALRPAEARDASRLLHVRQDGLSDLRFPEIEAVLREGDVLVINDTKVIPAALHGFRPKREEGGGGDVAVDVNLLSPLAATGGWRCLARPAKRLREGDVVEFGHGLSGKVLLRDGKYTDFLLLAEGSLDEALDQAGRMPLPPYIARKRAADDSDRERYQTVYAQKAGSVAAPTAGLHFTDDLLSRLEKKGVGRLAVTLHVGAGTFLPVETDDVSEHKMHAEWGEVTPEAAALMEEARAKGGRIVCVGTTSLRLVETAAKSGRIEPFKGETDIFITPGFGFKGCDLLLTNFHLPRSTLFMLVCAFSGTERMKAAYAHAVDAGYRFYSYGDACLLERDR